MPRELVGRERELATVASALAGWHAGGSAAVSVAGEAGIGKSAFLDAVVAAAPPARLGRLTGFAPARSVPLSAAADLLRGLAAVGADGTALARVLADPDDRELRPLRVFEAVRAALLPLAPVLLVVDDLQWADDLSLALVHHLARAAHLDGVALGVVWAARPGERLEQFSHGFRDLPEPVVELTLGPLDRPSGAALVRSLDPQLSAAAAAELASLAAGSPFWITALVERGAHPGSRHTSAQDAVRALLAGLAGDPAELFAALVVAARPLSPADLSALTGWHSRRLAPAGAELVERGLARRSGGALVVVHDLVRETAYRGIPVESRRQWHRRVAEWLRSTAAADDMSVLMEALAHWDLAGSPPLDLALAIAASPRRRLLGVEELRRLAALADTVPGDEPVVQELQAAVAALAAELGERDDACRRWTRLADQLPTPSARARAALSAAQQAIDLERSQDAARMLARVREVAGSDPWLGVEADALDHARRLWVDHDGASARPVLERAVTGAGRLADGAGGVDRLDDEQRRAYVQVMTAAWDAALVDDDLPAMAAAAQARLEGTRGRGATEEHLVAQADAARLQEWYGRDELAFEGLAAVLGEARRQVYPALVADLCHLLAYSAYHLGRLGEALERLDEAEAVEARLAGRTRRSVPWICGSLRPVIEASTADWRAAVDTLQARSAAEANPHLRLRLHQWTAYVAARFGGGAIAEFVVEQTEAALRDARAAGCERCRWSVVLAAALDRLYVGDVDSARRMRADWCAAHPTPHEQAAVERAWVDALLAAAADDPAALAQLEGVVALTRRRGRRLDEVWALLDLGRAQARGQPADAARSWQQAAVVAADLGARSESQLLSRLLRGVGVRRAPAGPGDGSGPRLATLTAREREVAAQAVVGRRNAEIAAALFLSTKTVERHLSSIFAKLQVRGRGELSARYGARLGAAPAPDSSP